MLNLSQTVRPPALQFSNRGRVTKRVCSASISVQGSALQSLSSQTELVPAFCLDPGQLAKYPPTAAVVNPRILLEACSSPQWQHLVGAAMNFDRCPPMGSREGMACRIDKATVNVGAEFVRLIKGGGRVATDIDLRVSMQSDVESIIQHAEWLWSLYEEMKVERNRILWRLPATWSGIEAAGALEAKGFNCLIDDVYCVSQAVAAAQVGVSVVSINPGKISNWYGAHKDEQRTWQERKHAQEGMTAGGTDSDLAGVSGPYQSSLRNDPGTSFLLDAYLLVKHISPKTNIMAAGVRNPEEALELGGIDFIVVSEPILDALSNKKSAPPGIHLTADAVKTATFPESSVAKVTRASLESDVSRNAMAKDLLSVSMSNHETAVQRLEEFMLRMEPIANL